MAYIKIKKFDTMKDKIKISRLWEQEQGLITINLASKLIGISQQSVSQLADRERIKSYQIDKKRYLSYKDVVNYIICRK